MFRTVFPSIVSSSKLHIRQQAYVKQLLLPTASGDMFREIILPIFRSTRLCVTASGIMHSRCCRPATSWVHYTTSCNTQSSASEDGRDHRPKHAELIGILNKPLLLHLVGVYIIYINDARSNKYQISNLLRAYLILF